MRRFTALPFAILLAAPHTLSAQFLRVEVFAVEPGSPIEGASVVLARPDGTRVRGLLTDTAGRALFPIPGPGTYLLTAQMIGRRSLTVESAPLAGPDTVVQRLGMEVYAIPLEGIEVEASGQCQMRADAGAVISRLWEEAEKALRVQEWTLEESLYLFQIVRTSVDLSRGRDRTVPGSRTATLAVTSRPFTSLSGKDLREGGYVRPRGPSGEHDYYIPDAAVLLSDAFLSTHCLELSRDRVSPGLIGIRFSPVPWHSPPDVEGTLWMDRKTGQLRSMDVRYTWSPWELAGADARALVVFDQMPGGSWIVRRWSLQVPRVGARRSGARIRLLGFREIGGETARLVPVSPPFGPDRPEGMVSGMVWDTATASPLVGAEIYLDGEEPADVTDSFGTFLLRGVPPGPQTMTILHPDLGGMGANPLRLEVAIDSGKVHEIVVQLPPGRRDTTPSRAPVPPWARTRPRPSPGHRTRLAGQ